MTMPHDLYLTVWGVINIILSVVILLEQNIAKCYLCFYALLCPVRTFNKTNKQKRIVPLTSIKHHQAIKRTCVGIFTQHIVAAKRKQQRWLFRIISQSLLFLIALSFFLFLIINTLCTCLTPDYLIIIK